MIMKAFLRSSVVGLLLMGWQTACAQTNQRLEKMAKTVTASHTEDGHAVSLICDGNLAATAPYWSSYHGRDAFGSEEWVEYEWVFTCQVNRTSILWKAMGDSLLLPNAARFEWWDGQAWQPGGNVSAPSASGVSSTKVDFATKRLRLYMQSPAACGIREFQITGDIVDDPFDPSLGYQWPAYYPTLNYDFRDEYPALPAPTKGRLPEKMNVARERHGEWWSVAVGPKANPLISDTSLVLLVKKMDEDFAYFRNEMGWPPDKRARNGYYSQVYGYGSGVGTDNEPNTALGGWQSATSYNGSSWPMVLLSYYPIYSFDPSCTYGDRIAQQNACVHEGIHATFADLDGCKQSAWFHEGGNTWLQGEAEVRKSGKAPESMGWLSAGNMLAPFMPIECYSGWLQDDSFGGPSAEGVNMYNGSQQVCTWRRLLGGVQYGELFPHFCSEILGKGSIPWIWRYCKRRVLEGMANGTTENGKKIEGLGEKQMRRLILEYRSRQAMLDVGLWTKACEKLLDDNWRATIEAEWEPYWIKCKSWRATPYAQMTAVENPDSIGWWQPEWRTTPGWSGANQVVLHTIGKAGHEVKVQFQPLGKNMVCQLCYRTKKGNVHYGQPLEGAGEASILLTEEPANGIIIAVICNTDYIYTGETLRKTHFDYRLRMGENAYKPASPNYKWYKYAQTIKDATYDYTGITVPEGSPEGASEFGDPTVEFAIRPAHTLVRAGESLPLTLTAVQNWQVPVQLLTATGQLLEQRSFLRNGDFPLPTSLTPGIYILRAMDGRRQATARIMVR